MPEGNTICLTAVGHERPGIVSAITGVLFDTDCNIRDSTMTILMGEFVMLLIVELPASMSNASLDQALSDVERRFDLGIFIKRLEEAPLRYRKPPGTKNWAVTIYGGDRKGMLHHVASLMARKGISITELKTKVLGGMEGAGIISMKVVAPPEVELAGIRNHLHDVATRFGVEVSIG
jgi:glycine cleavage system transcriptional repressor